MVDAIRHLGISEHRRSRTKNPATSAQRVASGAGRGFGSHKTIRRCDPNPWRGQHFALARLRQAQWRPVQAVKGRHGILGVDVARLLQRSFSPPCAAAYRIRIPPGTSCHAILSTFSVSDDNSFAGTYPRSRRSAVQPWTALFASPLHRRVVPESRLVPHRVDDDDTSALPPARSRLASTCHRQRQPGDAGIHLV